MQISNNTAPGSVAGIYADGSSNLQLSSDARRHVRDSISMSGRAGGGLHMFGGSLHASGPHVVENSTDDVGGGVRLTTASVELDRGNPTAANAPHRTRCSRVSRNTSADSGGASHAAAGSHVDLRQPFVESNRAVNCSAVLCNGGTAWSRAARRRPATWHHMAIVD